MRNDTTGPKSDKNKKITMTPVTKTMPRANFGNFLRATGITPAHILSLGVAKRGSNIEVQFVEQIDVGAFTVTRSKDFDYLEGIGRTKDGSITCVGAETGAVVNEEATRNLATQLCDACDPMKTGIQVLFQMPTSDEEDTATMAAIVFDTNGDGTILAKDGNDATMPRVTKDKDGIIAAIDNKVYRFTKNDLGDGHSIYEDRNNIKYLGRVATDDGVINISFANGTVITCTMKGGEKLRIIKKNSQLGHDNDVFVGKIWTAKNDTKKDTDTLIASLGKDHDGIAIVKFDRMTTPATA